MKRTKLALAAAAAGAVIVLVTAPFAGQMASAAPGTTTEQATWLADDQGQAAGQVDEQ